MRALLALLVVAAASVAEDAPPPRPAPPAGVWEGALDLGLSKLRLSFTVKPTKTGYSATMVSLDQGSGAIPMDEFTLDKRSVGMAYKAGGAKFAGTLSADGSQIAGTWEQSRAFPLTLKRVAVASELRRPQLPKPPFPYSSEVVTFTNAQAGITLSGTLTLPAGKPVAAVVTVSGSGPQDRDSTLFGHKPFLVIADALSRRGIAVLRYDDRGVGASEGKQKGATSTDLAADALAALRCVAQKTGLPASKVGIVGHSEGGLIGPMVAADHPDSLGFVVMLAGPAVTGADILAAQSVTILRGTGASEKALAARLAFGKRTAELLAAVKPGEFPAALAKAAAEAGAGLTQPERDSVGLGAAGVLALAAALADPWQKAFLLTDPARYLKRVKSPVLAVFGGKDVQVDAKANAPAVTKALPAAVVETYPELNHLFQPAKTGALSEYAEIETTFDLGVLRRVGDWVLATTKGEQ